jgi:hypothetical protein
MDRAAIGGPLLQTQHPQNRESIESIQTYFRHAASIYQEMPMHQWDVFKNSKFESI